MWIEDFFDSAPEDVLRMVEMKDMPMMDFEEVAKEIDDEHLGY
jgi:hypothetical protein